MSLDFKEKIRVYNYEQSPVGFPSQHNQQGIFIRGRNEDEEFVVERVAFDDIEVENSKSDLFKVGRIRFHPDEEDEIYKKLGIEDRENIMTDKELVNFLSTDTIENVKKISNIKSLTLISRMKSMLFSMERSGKIAPPRISASVLERNNELISGGKRNPESQINKILEAEKKADEENRLRETLNELTQKIENIEKEKLEKDELLAKSQSAIEQLLKQVEELKNQSKDELSNGKGKVQTHKADQEKKQAGRPPKNR